VSPKLLEEHNFTSHADLQSRASTATNALLLKVLLVSDLVAFTATIHRLGDEQGHALIRCHNRLMRECLSRDDGLEVAHTGDGMIMSFDSADSALSCAARIQWAFARYNSRSPVAPLLVRLGLHAGRPRHEEGRLFGACVNTAVRVCAMAGGQEVLLSRAVAELVHSNTFSIADRGEMAFKGLPTRLQVYAFEWRADSALEVN
jgi:class 3 adenylate cyclase